MISSVWVAVAAMWTWGRNSFTRPTATRLAAWFAHGEDDEFDSGIEAESAPEVGEADQDDGHERLLVPGVVGEDV